MRLSKLTLLVPFLILVSCSGETTETSHPAPPTKKPRTSDNSTSKSEVESLIAQLSDEDPEIRSDAAVALGELGDKRAIPPLADAVNDSDGIVSESAGDALVKIGEPVVEELRDALKNPDAVIREIAVYCLGQIGHPSAIETLREMWKGDEDIYVRMGAAFGLAKIVHDDKAYQFLSEGLNSKDGHAIISAAKALGLLKDSNAVVPLTRILLDGNPLIAPQAATSLADIGDERAIAPLIEVLRLPLSSYVQRHEDAENALERMTGQDFGTDHAAWKAWYEKSKDE